MIGLISAMDSELRSLVDMMENMEIKEYAGLNYYSGTLKGKDIVICNCGVGKVNAAMHTQILIDRYAPDVLIQNGVAGSLDAGVRQLDMVIGSEVVYHDMQEFVLEQYGPLEKVYYSDPKLVELAKEAAGMVEHDADRIHVGRIATGDWFVSSAEEKDRIVAYTHALCTEMEGCAVAHTAFLNKVPFIVLRSISDMADDSATMDYADFAVVAAKEFVDFVLELIAGI